jgi:geranylgeranyl diphosphate synthase type I
LAFQIQDDVLGIWGKADVTGKPVADDIRRRKKSLPVVYVLGRQNDPDAEAVAILDGCHARPYAEELARQHLEMALTQLEAARPDQEADEALRELAQFLIKRNY